MSKVAKLVLVSFMTRVVVEEDATHEQILDLARPMFLEKVSNELGENLEDIIEDQECPYDESQDIDTYDSIVKNQRKLCIDEASRYLLEDDEHSIEDQVEIIAKANDDDIIDYLDGVNTWEVVEFRFTCKDFLETINYIPKPN